MNLEDRVLEETGAIEGKMIPAKGFLADYFNLFSPLTEAPEIWHLMMAYTVLGAVVGNKRYIPMSWGKVYPVIWMLFVGMSSAMKKSTTLGFGKRLLHRANIDIVYPTEFSREALLQHLSEHPSGLFVWNEVAGNLQMFEANYMKGTKAMLTDLFDSSRYSRVTKGEKKSSPLKHTIIEEGACISIAAASTLEWLNKSVNETDSDAGFLPRFCFVTGDGISAPIAWPESITDDEWRPLVETIQDIYTKVSIAGHAMFPTREAKDFYSDWYCDLQKRIPKENPLLVPYIKRQEVYLHKFAMLNQINSNPLDPEISIDAYESAKYTTLFLERNIRRLCETNLFESDESRFSSKVIRIMRANGGSIPRGELYRVSHPPNDKFLDQVVKVLFDSGKITAIQEKTAGRTKTVYILAESLNA